MKALLRWNPTLILGQFAGLAIIYLIFFLLGVPASFFSMDNTKLVLVQTVIVGVGALGMTLIIIGGGIDLSVGSIIALSSVTTALSYKATESLLVAVPVGILTGALSGFMNGLMVVTLRIVPFIATLGTLGIARGIAKIAAGERTVNPPDSLLSGLMQFDRGGPFYSFPPAVWIMFLLALGVSFLLNYTVFGRYTFALGSNESTARLCGVPVALLKGVLVCLVRRTHRCFGGSDFRPAHPGGSDCCGWEGTRYHCRRSDRRRKPGRRRRICARIPDRCLHHVPAEKRLFENGMAQPCAGNCDRNHHHFRSGH
ncbi:MAG: ABC transporter permease [Candidatus Omnitrophica bacterium]|nr:ABC transporter permease [Candidatus Omnitrophota bacterium]